MEDEVHLTYLFRNLRYRIAPGSTEIVRRLRREQDPGYVYERDRHPVREKHHGGGGWKEGHAGDLHYRDYASYDEYVAHQQQKFTEMLKLQGGFTGRQILEYRERFYRRFRHLPACLAPDAVIVCAGARQGTEVEVLRDLGFRNAYGIDLNPGPGNPLVRPGDFMKMDNAPGTVDLIYSNCLDHAFDLDGFLREHRRVLKPEGYALYDFVPAGGTGAFEAVEWDSEEALLKPLLASFRSVVKLESEEHWKWVLLKGPRPDDTIDRLLQRARNAGERNG
jgi:SAM-dependent methyltransferase